MAQRALDCDMKKIGPTSLLTLLALAAVTAVTVFVLTRLVVNSGASPFTIPRLLILMPVAIGAVVAWQGWLVRAYKLGKRHMSPLRAARIWVLSQATSRAGAIMAGGAGGVALAYVTSGPTTFLTDQALSATLALLGSLVMTICGYVAERWCMIDDDGEVEPTGQQPLGV